MRLVVEPTIKNKKITNSLAAYQPKGRVRERLAQIRQEMQIAELIRNQSYTEFNDRSLIEYMDECQRNFNSYVSPVTDNPTESWRANTRRPITRNKIISIAAHVTGSLIYPNVVAQNEQDEEDRTAGMVMKDLMEWSWERSGYERAFVYSVISAAVNPACFIYEGYAEVKRKIKEITKKGKWTERGILDEMYSGFLNNIIPVDELFIADIYEHDIQKQPFLIWRRVIDYNNAKLKYGNNPLFDKYIEPGLREFYEPSTDSFYDEYDEDLEERLVEEVIYYNRFADLELHILNGVLMDDPDQPNPRHDKNYPFVKSGYELIDEGRFFYYKSLADKLKDDQRTVDTMYNMVQDGAFLQLMPPLAVFGDEHVNTSVYVPGSTHPFNDDTKIQPLSLGSNITAGLQVIQKIESSIAESSSDVLQSGQTNPGDQTAYEVSRLETNAKIVLGLFGKMVKFMVEDFGKLRLNTILQYMTVNQMMEITNPEAPIKFRSILIPDKVIDGKKKSRKIEFVADLPEEGTKEHEDMQYEMMKKEDENDMEIIKVNPSLFTRLKYLVKVTADMIASNSEAVKKALDLEAHDRMIQDPNFDQYAVSQLLVDIYKPGEADKFLKKKEDLSQPQPTESPGKKPKGSSKLVSQITGNNLNPELATSELAR